MSSFFSSHVIETLDLERHWKGVEQLLEIEEWPFIKADLKVSDQQERSIGLIARIGTEVRGFFTIHHFGDIAYLDMVVIHPEHRNNVVLAGDLWRTAKLALKQKGFSAIVAHCTRSTSGVLRILGYKAGLKFKLLRKDVQPGRVPQPLERLTESALDDLIALDTQVFGASRAIWLQDLMRQPSTRFHGRYEGSTLLASACLRERRENSLCIDACNALEFAPLEQLLTDIAAAHPDKRLECFVRNDSDLQHFLESNAFQVPDFFTEIGPLVEYRTGDTGAVGLGPNLRSLSWI